MKPMKTKSPIHNGGTMDQVICMYCKHPIEPCLERKFGWKHKQPWSYLPCGGGAKPLVESGESK